MFLSIRHSKIGKILLILHLISKNLFFVYERTIMYQITA